MKKYWPLVVLILVAILAASALAFSMQSNVYGWMHFFMGIFFCLFAMLKLFQPMGFVEGFLKYDLVAKRFPVYAYVYPLIELGLGLSFLSFIFPATVCVVTVIVMGVGAIGVIRALRAGLDVRCACMGTLLDVPLSTVTLTEDIAMGLMAILMLIMRG